MSDTQYIAIDTETERISYLNPVPDLICLTHAVAGELKGSIKTPWENPIDTYVGDLWAQGHHTIGHNISFDLSILAFKYPTLMPNIFAALDADLVHDTLLREILLNITRHGTIDMLEVNGAAMHIGYALVDLEKKYLNLDRSELKDDEDAPRLNYNIYKNVPVAQWDNGFISYAVDDAINTGLVFAAQEKERQACIETMGIDPFKTEAAKVRRAFGLRLIECVGSCLDGKKVEEVAAEFRKLYGDPKLREPLLKASLLLAEVPPQPYANGAQEHVIECPGNKDNPSYKKGAKIKCGCPPKMKAAEAEKNPTKPLFQHIWKLAHDNPLIEAWPADAYTVKLKQEGMYEQVVSGKAIRHAVIQAIGPVMPDDVTLQRDAEWQETFCALDPLLSVWSERKALSKIITDYLPKFYYTDEATGQTYPAAIIRSSFSPIKLTGRSGSKATKFYPSRNDQNVDPRVRPCTIPRQGNIICSTDYNGMELGTLAEKCFQLFGFSELADKINNGIDTHAFLGAQIAYDMDKVFAEMCNSGGANSTDARYNIFKICETFKEPCESPAFCDIYKHEHTDLDRPVLWSDFFKHYRTLAKPVGLGYPGGLGAPTLVTVAKASYGLVMSIETAKHFKEIWLETYPEMGLYLEWIAKHCVDAFHEAEPYTDDNGKEKKRVFFAYETPDGMVRTKCGFCEAANGAALQAPSAEGALDGLYENQKYAWLSCYSEQELLAASKRQQWKDFVTHIVSLGGIFNGVLIINFIHDEILWEQPEDDKMGARAKVLESIMVKAMRRITPDVKAGATTAAMRRWDKNAKSIWEGERLVVWEPEPAKKLAETVASK